MLNQWKIRLQKNPWINSLQKSRSTELDKSTNHPNWVAFEPSLVPPLSLMRLEGISILEEWFRWAEEWSMLLRIYGGITPKSKVLEIGCGLGRIAFPLRYILTSAGSYDGFEICQEKVNFLEQTFHQTYPNFRFIWANLHNTFYNPAGQINAQDYRFPYEDNHFDLVFAASVFTHLLPNVAAHYFQETSRVLKPSGKAVFSFFLLDYYRRGQPRPGGFAYPIFNCDYSYDSYGDEFAIAEPNNPEFITAYRRDLIQRFADQAGLKLAQDPIPGFWSGTVENWVGTQDLIVLQKRS